MWKIFFTKNALKDRQRIKEVGLEKKVKNIIDVMMDNPFSRIPPYEKLVGKLVGYYSRRINVQHRLVYRVDEENKIVIISSMWSHYE